MLLGSGIHVVTSVWGPLWETSQAKGRSSANPKAQKPLTKNVYGTRKENDKSAVPIMTLLAHGLKNCKKKYFFHTAVRALPHSQRVDGSAEVPVARVWS